MSKGSEPAIKSYFFGKGYSDLRATIADSWQFNVDSASRFGKKADFDKGLEASFLSMLNIAAAFSVIVFGTLFFLVVSVVHVTVLCLFFALIYLMFTLVYGAERVYLLIKGFATVCPHCHSKRALPEYYCDNPKCGNIHHRLIPSSYGIFKHTCKCGQILPATFFLNRGRLQSRCGACAQLLPRENTESRKLFVAIMGGPSVGKSSYLFSTVWKLIEEKLPQMGFSHDFIDAQSRNAYEQVRKNMQEGRPPDKTTAKLPRAFNIMFRGGTGRNRLLYFYDPAGEAYADADSLVLHKYQDYLSGCIFLIDPFSIPNVRQTYTDDLATNERAIKPGPLQLEDALSRLLLSMEEHYGLTKTERIKFPIAVVINKLDAFDLESHIGDVAVHNHIKSNGTAISFETARDSILRNQLEYWGQRGFVQRIEARFSKVHYFACSALGRLPQGAAREFAPRGVLDPLMWILAEADHEIPTGIQSSNRRLARITDLVTSKAAYAVAALVPVIVGLWFLLSPAEKLMGSAQQPTTVETNAQPAINVETGTIPLTGPRPDERVPQVADPPLPPSTQSALPPQMVLAPPVNQTATLALSINVEGAAVLIDGSYRGQVSRGLQLRLPAGRHDLRIEKAGYAPWRGTVNLLVNQVERLTIDVKPSEPTPQDRALQLLKRAEQLFQQRQYDEAISACNEGLRWDPANRALQAKKSSIERVKQVLERPTNN